MKRITQMPMTTPRMMESLRLLDFIIDTKLSIPGMVSEVKSAAREKWMDSVAHSGH